MTLIVLGVLATLLTALATAGVVRSVVDASSSPAARAKRRVRGGDGGEAAAKERVDSALLMSLVAISSSGLPSLMCEVLAPFAAMTDPSGTKRDGGRLAQAGLGRQVTASEVLRARALAGLLTGCALGAIYFASLALALLFGLLGFVLGVRLPSFAISAAAEKRQRQCLRELPEMVDMISLASRAGMGFDAALASYCSRFDTVLGAEFGAALDSWSVGARTREEALLAVSEGLQIDAVSRFVAAVLQALKLGSPLARVLSDQAEDARTSQRLEVEELIGKAPVKMFLPMGALILPAMLILMLGPMMLQLLAGMGPL